MQKTTELTAGLSSGENVRMPHTRVPNDITAGIARTYHEPLGTTRLILNRAPRTRNVTAYAERGMIQPGIGTPDSTRNAGLKNVVWNTSHTHAQNKPNPIERR